MLVLLAAIVAQAAPPSATLPSPSCRYDKAAMLALDERSFDQDMAGGWRALNNVGCDAAAADAIRDWRAAHPQSSSIFLLNWHEGQMRANVGQTAEAIALFEASRKSIEQDAGFGWNLYVDGTIAFLQRDAVAFEAARAKLAALPRPAKFNPVGPNGKPLEIRWPLNLNVLEGFQRCWWQPYKQAYSVCATPMSKVEAPTK